MSNYSKHRITESPNYRSTDPPNHRSTESPVHRSTDPPNHRPTGSPTLSVVAISYNEEQDLPDFLKNLLPWVDEIVIVDDESTDQTARIAQAAGEKVNFIVHKRTEEDGFAGQRNIGLQHATSDWVLNMDIDERVSPQLKQEMLQGICNTPLNAFRYKRLNFFLHRKMTAGGWDSWNNPQLARRTHHYYVGKIHEHSVVEGAPGTIGQLNGQMWHLNDNSYAERMRKSFQYCNLEADKLLEAGKRVSSLGILVQPIREFIKKYVVKQGFRDGTAGLIAALHSACATFRTHALVWDAQNRISREQLEIDVNRLKPNDESRVISSEK